MEKNQKEDLIIDALHDLRNAINECLNQIETENPDGNSSSYMIDAVETEFHKLNLKTNEIYTEMLSRAIEERETREVIESKKANTSERV